MVNWQNVGRIAGHALNIVGAGLDYASGKAEGEDDFRAGAGAVASGLGGWKGALAGAGAGAPFGPAGALAGGVIGGMAGSFAGGWTADRADELIRGKNTGIRNNTGARNNMSNVVRTQDGQLAEVDDNGNFLNWVVPATVLGIAGDGLYRVGQEARRQGLNPIDDFRFNRAMGANTIENLADVADRTRGVVGQGLRNTGDDIARVWNRIPGNNAVKGTALAAFALDQMTGGNVTKAIGRGIAGGADIIANAVGFKTDFDGQNQMSQQAMKEDRENQRVEQNRGIYNPYDDEIYKRYRMLFSEDAFNRENAIWNRNRDEAWRVADKADEVSRRNYLTNFTANQANALLQGYMTDIPNSVNNSLRTVFSARYN